MPGPIRAGFAYQDLVAMRAILDLLKYPENVEEVQLEADDAGSLDDVVTVYKDGSRRHEQVKLSVDPSGAWTWDDLIAVPGAAQTPKRRSAGKAATRRTGASAAKKRGTGRRARSLLEKWFDSVASIAAQHENITGDIVTNRTADDDLAKSLGDDGRLIFDQIPDNVRLALIDRYGEDAARAAASRLYFRLESAGPEELRKRVRDAFERIANVAHFSEFESEVRSWGDNQVFRKTPKIVHIEDARRAARFYSAIPLPERLEVPSDFVIPDDQLDEALLAALAGNDSRILVLEADAGAGKSTYVSDLYRRLRLQPNARSVVRHHFWLSSDDPNRDRIKYDIVAYSLMMQLKANCPELLMDVAIQSPDPARLGDWIDSVAKAASEKQTSVIVMLDGLDHALLPLNAIDTREILNVLAAPREGLKILIASRPRAYPAALTDRRFERIALPRLSRRAIAEILSKHADLFCDHSNGDEDRISFDDAVDQMLVRTGGLALHVRTAILILKKLGRPLTRADFDDLPGELAAGAEQFYAVTWARLSKNERMVLSVLARHALPWQQNFLVAVLKTLGLSVADAISAVDGVSELLEKSTDETITIHFSLLTFVREQREYDAAGQQVDSAMREFLRSADSPEAWQWSYLPELDIRAGRVADVIERLDRAWFVSAIAEGRRPPDVRRLILQTLKAALEAGDLNGYLSIGILYDYYESANDGAAEVFQRLEAIATADAALEPGFAHNLTFAAAKTISQTIASCARSGQTAAAERAYQELLRRFNDVRTRDVIDDAIISGVVLPFIEASGTLGRNANNIAALLRTNKGHYFARDIARSYLSTATRCGNFAALETVLSAAEEANISVDASIAISDGALDAGRLLSPNLASRLEGNGTVQLVRATSGAPTTTIRYDAVPGLEDYGTGSYTRVQWLMAFHAMLADALNNRSEAFHSITALLALRPSMRDVEESLRSVWSVIQRIAGGQLRSAMTALSESQLGGIRITGNRDYREDQCAWGFKAAVCDVMLDSVRVGLLDKLSENDVREVTTNTVTIETLTGALSKRATAASPAALDFVISSATDAVDKSLEDRYTRATQYLEVVALAISLNRENAEATARRRVGGALMSYDYHKDIFLGQVIAAVRQYGQRNREQAVLYLLRLATPVHHIREITDGDTTRYFPAELGDALLELDEGLFAKYYFALISDEDMFTLGHIRQSFLMRASGSDLSKRLLNTIRDKDTLVEVAKAAQDSELRAAAREMTAIEDAAEKAADATPQVGASPEGEPAVDVRTIAPSELLQVTPASRYRLDLVAWTRHWLVSERADEAIDVLHELVKSTRFLDASWDFYDAVRSVRGPADAYPILVALLGPSDWYFWGKETRMRVQSAILQNHPERATSFVCDSLKNAYRDDERYRPHPSGFCSAIVRYLIAIGSEEVAARIVALLVDMAMQITSSWRLAAPTWVDV